MQPDVSENTVFLQFPNLAGWHSANPLKRPRKIVDAGKTSHGADLGHGIGGVANKVIGSGYPNIVQIIVDGHSGRPFEELAQVCLIVSQCFCQGFQIKGLRIVIVYIMCNIRRHTLEIFHLLSG